MRLRLFGLNVGDTKLPYTVTVLLLISVHLCYMLLLLLSGLLKIANLYVISCS